VTADAEISESLLNLARAYRTSGPDEGQAKAGKEAALTPWLSETVS
jgi:hypothetical protein